MYTKRLLQVSALATAIVFAIQICAFAIPTQDEINVVSGDVQISHTDTSLTFNVTSDKAIINMNSFSVGSNEIVNFRGPQAEVLARVTGGAPSEINGALFSDLQILALVNESGIHIGPEARIEVANMILSTRNITDSNFVNSDYIFEKLSKEAQDMLLLNEGHIEVRNGGFGVLIAGAIENRGVITATAGQIILAGGDAVKIDISSNGLISVAIDQETASTIYDYNGNSVLDQIKNSGAINGQGSLVFLQAKSLTDIFRSTINLEGWITTTRIEEKDGEFKIVADGDINLNCNITGVTVEAVTDEDLRVYGDIRATGGDITLTADKDGDGEGEFHQLSGTIEAEGEGNIYIDGSGDMTIHDVRTENGEINIGSIRTPETVTELPSEEISLTGNEVKITVEDRVEISTAAETTHIVKSQGDLVIEDVLYLDEEFVAIIGEHFGRVEYYIHGNITLEVPRGDVNTIPGVILPGIQVKISALRIGSHSNPVGINADITYINRIQGFIDVSEIWGMGTTVTIRGPAPQAADSSWGAVSYNKSSHLVLEAEKTTFAPALSTAGFIILTGDITLFNFENTIPNTIIYFDAVKTYTFKGSLDLGPHQVDYPVHLLSSEPGKVWYINADLAEKSIQRVSVQDSVNLGSELLYASPSFNKGNNFGWHLNTAYWTGVMLQSLNVTCYY